MENRPENTEAKMKFRILVVDDQPDDVKPMIHAFKFHGHEVKTAVNGKQALAMLLQGGIDCVCIDLMMPEMSGDALLIYMQRYPELKELSFVIVTAIQDNDLVHKAYRQVAYTIRGGFRQFVKPAEPERILEIFERDTKEAMGRLHRKPGDYGPLLPDDKTTRLSI